MLFAGKNSAAIDEPQKPDTSELGFPPTHTRPVDAARIKFQDQPFT